MKAVTAAVVAGDEPWAGARRLVLHAPRLVQEAAAGQFVAAACADPPPGGVPLLRRSLWIAGMARPTGELVVLYEPRGRGTAWLAARAVGSTVDLLGPLGRPLAVADTTRRALLIGRGVAGLAPLLGLATELAAREVEVTLLAGAATISGLPPATLLHSAVEYQVATGDGTAGRQGEVLQLVAPFLSWADQVYASLPRADYEPLLALVRRHTLRPRRGFVQALLGGAETLVPCGTGACDGCTVRTRDGFRRLCREGAAFDLHDLVG